MNSSLNFSVGLEQVADRHRAADQSRLAAEVREQRVDQPRERKLRTSRVSLGLRRRPKVA
jgi:hypothetical protein